MSTAVLARPATPLSVRRTAGDNLPSPRCSERVRGTGATIPRPAAKGPVVALPHTSDFSSTWRFLLNYEGTCRYLPMACGVRARLNRIPGHFSSTWQRVRCRRAVGDALPRATISCRSPNLGPYRNKSVNSRVSAERTEPAPIASWSWCPCSGGAPGLVGSPRPAARRVPPPRPLRWRFGGGVEAARNFRLESSGKSWQTAPCHRPPRDLVTWGKGATRPAGFPIRRGKPGRPRRMGSRASIVVILKLSTMGEITAPSEHYPLSSEELLIGKAVTAMMAGQAALTGPKSSL